MLEEMLEDPLSLSGHHADSFLPLQKQTQFAGKSAQHRKEKVLYAVHLSGEGIACGSLRVQCVEQVGASHKASGAVYTVFLDCILSMQF